MNRRLFLLSTGVVAAAAMLPAPLRAAPFTSRRISVVVQGSGPDVVMIPGLTASRDMWKATIAAAPGYRYHLVQVNGFAGHAAGANASGAVVAPVAAEIARYIAEARLRPPAIIGHSMGGTLAMMLASRYPARVGKLMVVDMLPQPAGLFGSDAASIRPLADGLLGLFGSSPGGKRLLGQMMGQYGAGAAATGSNPDVVAQATHELALLDLTRELPRIKVPMRVVYALPPAGGNVTPASVDRNFRTSYAGARGARLVPIANSGHMVMYDQPARFRAEMKAFLKG